ncbi:DNA polymerase-4 [Breznakia sp. PF5-3]|uniref:DNA polymerase IV n=1 Tax=unclassified Breznakia TaxID=2623764 RepID=UPI002406428E|nr:MULTISPECIES: DNA polymerase IV [unclassified Breznakia]MDF9825745.1 DNA polymerase-4 [Breznakia sp. PM6-1]MDF9836564.1 DNA polymerase-4 [Breznakia sp. PF5-3]MDF9838782.1 DNA polymerase-4 [Breznakia sp. PFB2-8]MDF9860804.1 DNA polymerase-4 [Breznakia sp. PH5-24]
MNKDRVILHCDINHCYAQIEEMLSPACRDVPMVVGGNEEARHGIILAKNLKAKPFGIKTGEPIRDALRKCPGLFVIPPKYDKYQYYTEKVKDIYREYTDRVESFGLDEAWLDITGSQSLFGSGEQIAKEIQDRVFEELGLTISIGVSFNKIFAKLGSDMIKPKGLVIIDEENYKIKAWKLPVEDLLMVGKATQDKMNKLGIFTIGDLAKTSVKLLEKKFGKIGVLLWSYANGSEDSPVDPTVHKRTPKSIGNSWTTPKDITNFREAKIVYERLSNSVACRLRESGYKGNVIHISIRDTKLDSCTRQIKIDHYTDTAKEILQIAMNLLDENWNRQFPLRSIGVGVTGLKPFTTHTQYDLFGEVEERENETKVEVVVEAIRSKFGFFKIDKCSALLDTRLSNVDPKANHTIFPVGVLKGSIK